VRDKRFFEKTGKGNSPYLLRQLASRRVEEAGKGDQQPNPSFLPFPPPPFLTILNVFPAMLSQVFTAGDHLPSDVPGFFDTGGFTPWDNTQETQFLFSPQGGSWMKFNLVPNFFLLYINLRIFKLGRS
jgi:hypothetical protein